MIYFLQNIEGGPVKIGYSDDVDARRRQLEAHYGRPLIMLATMDGGLMEEKQVHKRFAHLRLKGRGRRGRRIEQFQPAPELMEFIGRPLLVGVNPEVTEAMPVSVIGLTIINLKGSQEYANWLEEMNQKTHIQKATIVRLALEVWAKQNGYPRPPKM